MCVIQKTKPRRESGEGDVGEWGRGAGVVQIKDFCSKSIKPAN